MSVLAPVARYSPWHDLGQRQFRLFHAGLLLSVPLVLLAMNPNVFINPGGNSFSDPWMYTGFFLSLPAHVARFGMTYYSTRLSWIVPGFLVHRALPPLAANYALHLGFFYAMLFATYRFLAAGAGRRRAILGTLLIAWSPAIQDAHSWDYVDGAGITYMVVALLCLEHTATSRHRLAWSAAAGAAGAFLVVTNITLVALLPAGAVFLLVRTGPPRWRAIAHSTLAAAAGAVAAFALFGSVNVAAGGQWLFLAPSIRFAQMFAGAPNPYKTVGFHWAEASWLALPAFATVGAVLGLAIPPRGDDSFARGMHAALITAVAAWMTSDLVWNSALFQYSYYASYLAPLAILSLALQGQAVDDSPRAGAAFELAVFATLAAVHLIFLRQGASVLSRLSVRLHASSVSEVAAALALAAGLLAVVAVRLIRPPLLRSAVFLSALALALAVPHYQGSNVANARTEFEVTANANRFITSAIGTHTIRIWYPPAGYDSPPFKSIACTLLCAWNLLNDSLPHLSSEQAATLPPDTRMVMLLHRNADVDEARLVLRRFGLDSSVVAHQEFGTGSRAVSVVIADLLPPRP